MSTRKFEADSATELDEHLLQYSKRRSGGTCDLVIGLDFGTSASKVVVRAPDLPGEPAFVVDFGEFAHSSMACLLPTELRVTSHGRCELPTRGKRRRDVVNDIKLELFADDHHLDGRRGPTQQGLRPESVATAYIALLLRHVRRTVLATQYGVIGNFRSFNWSMNLGVPSPCIEDNEENSRFRQVGKAAWMLSVMPKPITVGGAEDELRGLREAPNRWDQDDLACDFELIPEVAAAAAGYALSDHRREGLHLLIDVGAATVDICGFMLHEHDAEQRYGLLTADVKQIGTICLHYERIASILRVHEEHAQGLRDRHDPLTPIGERIEEYLPEQEEIVSGAQSADENVRTLR